MAAVLSKVLIGILTVVSPASSRHLLTELSPMFNDEDSFNCVFRNYPAPNLVLTRQPNPDQPGK